MEELELCFFGELSGSGFAGEETIEDAEGLVSVEFFCFAHNAVS